MKLVEFRSVAYVFGPFRVVPSERLLVRDGQPVPLPPKAWETLLALLDRAGHLVSKDELLSRVWPGAGVDEGSLMKCVSQLRKVLEPGPDSPTCIQTVPTKGYRFVAKVTVEEGASAAPARVASERVDSAVMPVAREPRARRAMRSYAVWAAAVALGLALGYWLTRPAPVLIVTSYRQITHDGLEKLKNGANGLPGALMTDGSRLYFMEDPGGGRFAPAEAAVSGGDTVSMPVATPDAALLGISPDGTEFLAGRLRREQPETPLWILPATTLSRRQVPGVEAHDASWAPDGKTIVFASGESLYSASPDGGSIRELVTVEGVPNWIRFSPDGRLIRFTVSDVNTWQTSIWQVSSDGTDLHPLLPGWQKPQGECCGSWTSDGKYYIFQDTQGQQTQLWALAGKHSIFGAAAARPIELTRGPMSFWDPLPGRDGRTIFAIGENRRGELVRYDRALGRFTLYLSGMSADHVEFSKDGKWIAYAAFPESTIWRSRPDGAEKLQLSFAPMEALFPRWSPDGKWIAFIGDMPGEPDKVYLVSAEGGSPKPMLAQGFSQFDPNWSPDGNEIMFAAYRPGALKKSSLAVDIEIYDLRTQKVTVLPGSAGLSAPRWSPDGRYVAATAIENDKWQIPAVRLYDFRTRKWTPFENDPIDNKWWSHDGRYFYFDKFAGTSVAVFRETLATRAVELVASLNGVRRGVGPMGSWMGLAPDDSPMVLRDTSTQEVYALTLGRR